MDGNFNKNKQTFFKFLHFSCQNARERIVINSFSKNLVDFYLVVLQNYFTISQ